MDGFMKVSSQAEHSNPVPVGMLVELLLVQPLRAAHGVLALVGGRRAGAGGDRDGQGPLRGRRRCPLCRRRTLPRRSHEPGTAAGVRHLAREVPPHEVDGDSGKGSPIGGGRGGADASAKSANAEGVERGEAALENTSSQVEDGEADRDAVGVCPKECQIATDASNARRPERRGTSIGNTRYG